MTEYTSNPEAVAQYLNGRNRTARWVTTHTNPSVSLASPSIPPSLVSDSDDGLSTPTDSDDSSHSLPPRMFLRYPDGRPDIPISESDQGKDGPMRGEWAGPY